MWRSRRECEGWVGLLILQTLKWGPKHGYAIVGWINDRAAGPGSTPSPNGAGRPSRGKPPYARSRRRRWRRC